MKFLKKTSRSIISIYFKAFYPIVLVVFYINLTYSQSPNEKNCDRGKGSQKKRDKPGSGYPGHGPYSGHTGIIASDDPNEIHGPAGYGIQRFIAKKDNIPYTILFENDPNKATAPAQIVRITYPISSQQNIASFRLGDFGFNQFSFQVPPNSAIYHHRLNLVDSMGLFVDITAGIDVTLHQAFWIFESIDPQTGLPPADPLAGFLPVKDTTLGSTSTHGDGFVNFTIKALSSTVTGDTCHANADIFFDINAAVPTNNEVHTLDAVAPISQITSSAVIGDTIVLQFSATDDGGGSGVKSYDLYVAQDSMNYSTYLTNVTDPVIYFPAASGSTYHFFSLSTDNVGNRETMKFMPDISITTTSTLPIFVKAFIEGYYLGNGTLIAAIDQVNYPDISDTLILQLAHSIPPYEILFSDTALLQTDGTVQFDIDASARGESYYLVLRHRNSIETWNALPLNLQGDTTSYDFTNSINKAYGNNLKDLGDGNFAMWSGDISDAIYGRGFQDGIIESQDYADLENAVSIILFGYVPEDITGDGIVEAIDYLILENNVANIIFSIRP